MSDGRSRSGCTRSGARSSSARNRRSSVAGEERVRLPPCARPRRGVRADPASAPGATSTVRPPSGSSRSAGPRITRRCSPTTTRLRSTMPVTPGRTRAPWPSKDGSRSEMPGIAPSRSTRSRQPRATTRSRVESWPDDDPECAGAPAQARPRVSPQRGREAARRRSRRRARPRSLGQLELAAEADALLAELWWFRAEPVDRPSTSSVLGRSSRDLPTSRAKARVLSQVSRYRMLAGAYEEAIRIGDRGPRDGRGAGAPGACRHTRSTTSEQRETNMGDARRLEDLERAVEIALAAGSSEVVARLQQSRDLGVGNGRSAPRTGAHGRGSRARRAARLGRLR